MNRRAASLIAVIFLCAICMVLLVACGGGGSSSSSSAPPTTTATPGPGGSGSGGTSGGGNSGSGNSGGGNGSGGSGGGTSGGGTGGSGGSSGGGGTPGGAGGDPTTAALAYVAGTNGFYGIRVDSSSNVTTVSGSPYSVSGNSLNFATSGNLLFVSSTSADFKSGFLTTYRSANDGTLTQLGTMTLKSSGTTELGVDPTGKFLYGTADVFAPGQSFVSPAILAFSIDQNSGKVTELPGSPFFLDGGMFPTSKPVFTPNGASVCLSMELGRTNEGARCYPRHADGSVDGKNVATLAGSDTTMPDIAANIDNMTVLFTNGERNQVVASPINTPDTKLTYPSGGSFSKGIATSSIGHWVVVGNRDSSNLSVFEAGVGGLAPTGNTAKTGGNPNRLAFSRSGPYLFVTTTSGTVVYSQDNSTGVLTPLNLSNPAPGDGDIATM